MGLLDRVRHARDPRRSSIDMWLADYLLPSTFGYNGHQYGIGTTPQQTMVDRKVREIANTLPAYAQALRYCPPAFAAQSVRSLVISQARFMFRRRPWVKTQPRALFGNSSLGLLETPWPNGTTADLLGRMEWHAGLAGNAYVTNRSPGRLRVLRPDWVEILYGSDQAPDEAAYAMDGEVIAYIYYPGGKTLDTKPVALLPAEVCHYAPLPDPEGSGIGMSWLTPALRDMQVDRATTDHKLAFFDNGATPNMVVKGIKATTQKQFDDMVDALERDHVGAFNAYRTLYLAEGADATVVGNNFTDMALRALQDGGEARIAVLSRVPAAMLGISEGLRGSALNESSFAMARRVFADTWLTASLQNLAASLAPLVAVPGGSELWFDTTDIPIMREDAQDATNIEQVKATTIVQYVNAGFTADSAIAAVDGQDVTLLVHTDLVSVQLQPPGAVAPGNDTGAAPANADTQPPPDTAPPRKAAARGPVGFAPPFVPATPTRYSPDQPRDDKGEWTSEGGPGLSAMVKATSENEGGSFKYEGGRLVEPTTGHMVAQRGGKIVTESQWRENARATLRQFRADNADAFSRGAYLGTWHDAAHGEYALDVSWNIQDKDEAMAFARANDQQAGWDVVKQEAWDAGGTGGRSAAARPVLRGVAGQLGRDDRGRAELLAGLRHRPDWLEARDFNPDEPRDPDGKWTSGGGGASDLKSGSSTGGSSGSGKSKSKSKTVTLPDGWTRQDIVINVDQDGNENGFVGERTLHAFVNESTQTRIYDATTTTGEPPQNVVDQINTLQQEYPVDVKSLDVRLVNGMDAHNAGETGPDYSYARFAGDAHGLGPSQNYIMQFNRDFIYGDPSTLREGEWKDTVNEGWAMPVAKTLVDQPGGLARYAMTHEYGHLVDMSTGSANQRNFATDWTPAEKDFSRQLFETPKGRDIFDTMSRYGDSSHQEAMAEGFAEHVLTDGKTTNAASNAVWAALIKAGAIKE